MNSLNIISARVSPPPSPGPTRTNSLSTLGLAVSSHESDASHRDPADHTLPGGSLDEKKALLAEPDDDFSLQATSPADDRDHHRGYSNNHDSHHDYAVADETTPLVTHSEVKPFKPDAGGSHWSLLPKRLASAFVNSLRWVLSALAAPGVYLIACLYDEDGNFAPLTQLRKLFGWYGGSPKRMAMRYHEKMAARDSQGMDGAGGNATPKRPGRLRRFVGSSGSSSSGLSSESESDPDRRRQSGRGGANSSRHRTTAAGTETGTASSKHLRTQSLPHHDSEESTPQRRSIRINVSSQDSLRQRKHRKVQSASGVAGSEAAGGAGSGAADISAQLKSPTSPIGALTKYPKTPAPPRPLVPRRQPSYINLVDAAANVQHQKTLILDLDETLIHSMAKGGRMGTGHMVEVRLNTSYAGVGGLAGVGPQHPILYYVHKRPHCDEFLRRVSKWYNLVVFTASVQEYADPVIDWLEADRKYFSARYYRQHCTFRHGAFIKDLSSVEPDLSKVIILDNSPMSYMFQQDNAIPIQGWISDPTDSDLMYLIPFLEGLQHVSDVRALLALRGGEDGQHMA